jgi:hypothetical protein
MLVEYNALSFQSKNINANGKDEEFSYFLVSDNIVRQLKIDEPLLNKLLKKKIYSADEVDDLLLGYFEEIGDLHKQGILSLEDINNSFGWHIKICWENPEIQKYIQQERKKPGNENMYENFEYIYNKLKANKMGKTK